MIMTDDKSLGLDFVTATPGERISGAELKDHEDTQLNSWRASAITVLNNLNHAELYSSQEVPFDFREMQKKITSTKDVPKVKEIIKGLEISTLDNKGKTVNFSTSLGRSTFSEIGEENRAHMKLYPMVESLAINGVDIYNATKAGETALINKLKVQRYFILEAVDIDKRSGVVAEEAERAKSIAQISSKSVAGARATYEYSDAMHSILRGLEDRYLYSDSKGSRTGSVKYHFSFEDTKENIEQQQRELLKKHGELAERIENLSKGGGWIDIATKQTIRLSTEVSEKRTEILNSLKKLGYIDDTKEIKIDSAGITISDAMSDIDRQLAENRHRIQDIKDIVKIQREYIEKINDYNADLQTIKDAKDKARTKEVHDSLMIDYVLMSEEKKKLEEALVSSSINDGSMDKLTKELAERTNAVESLKDIRDTILPDLSKKLLEYNNTYISYERAIEHQAKLQCELDEKRVALQNNEELRKFLSQDRAKLQQALEDVSPWFERQLSFLISPVATADAGVLDFRARLVAKIQENDGKLDGKQLEEVLYQVGSTGVNIVDYMVTDKYSGAPGTNDKLSEENKELLGTVLKIDDEATKIIKIDKDFKLTDLKSSGPDHERLIDCMAPVVAGKFETAAQFASRAPYMTRQEFNQLQEWSSKYKNAFKRERFPEGLREVLSSYGAYRREVKRYNQNVELMQADKYDAIDQIYKEGLKTWNGVKSIDEIKTELTDKISTAVCAQVKDEKLKATIKEQLPEEVLQVITGVVNTREHDKHVTELIDKDHLNDETLATVAHELAQDLAIREEILIASKAKEVSEKATSQSERKKLENAEYKKTLDAKYLLLNKLLLDHYNKKTTLSDQQLETLKQIFVFDEKSGFQFEKSNSGVLYVLLNKDLPLSTDIRTVCLMVARVSKQVEMQGKCKQLIDARQKKLQFFKAKKLEQELKEQLTADKPVKEAQKKEKKTSSAPSLGSCWASPGAKVKFYENLLKQVAAYKMTPVTTPTVDSVKTEQVIKQDLDKVLYEESQSKYEQIVKEQTPNKMYQMELQFVQEQIESLSDGDKKTKLQKVEEKLKLITSTDESENEERDQVLKEIESVYNLDSDYIEKSINDGVSLEVADIIDFLNGTHMQQYEYLVRLDKAMQTDKYNSLPQAEKDKYIQRKKEIEAEIHKAMSKNVNPVKAQEKPELMKETEELSM